MHNLLSAGVHLQNEVDVRVEGDEAENVVAKRYELHLVEFGFEPLVLHLLLNELLRRHSNI